MSGPAPRRRRGRILFSLLLLLLAIGVVPLLYTSYSLVTRSRETLEVNQKQVQQDKARSLASQVKLYVASVHGQIVTIANTLAIEADRRPFPELVQRLFDQGALKRYPENDDRLIYVAVVDAAGSAAFGGLPLPDPPIQEMLREAFQRTQRGIPMISVPLFSAALQEPVLVIGEPVNAASGVQGAVIAIASLQDVRQMTATSGEAGLLDVYLVDNRGRLIAHSDPEKPLLADMSGIEIVRAFLDSQQRTAGTAVTVPFDIPAEGGARKMLGTYMPVLDQSEWGVIVQVEEEKAYYDAEVLRRRSYALVALVTALAVVLGSLFAGQISRPIQKLAEGARRLAGGDYGTRVSIRSGNEVGILADTFNFMGEEIQQAIEQIKRSAQENKELFMGSIRMLANAIDEKDPYTRGHSERVAYYSACVAKHLGMGAEEVENVHLSGIIHDVGKIGIEDKILRKAAALTDDEYEIMKQHPTKGLHILEAVPLLKEKAGAGLMHHENVDGSGYPDGLKGDDIPLLGRIVSVADAFDAMTTDRPYSKAMTFEAAIARLKFLAGKKFDPVCVEAFERASEAGDVTPAKARRASVASRQFEINLFMKGSDGPPPPPAAAAEPPPPPPPPAEEADGEPPPVAAEARTDAAPAAASNRLARAWESFCAVFTALRNIVKTAGLLVLPLVSLVAVPLFAQSSPQAEARFNAGVMHMRAGRIDLALAEFKRAVDEDPKNPYFRKGLGQAYAAKQEWGDAIDEFKKALELNPYYVDVRNDLGTALILAGKRDEGKQEFVTAYGDPTNPTPETSAYNLGRAYIDEKNYAEAINWFRTSLSRNDKYAQSHLGLAEALVDSGRLSEAIADLEKAVELMPDEPELILGLGQAYFKDGRFKDARVRLEEAVKKDPGGPAGRAADQQLQSLPH